MSEGMVSTGRFGSPEVVATCEPEENRANMRAIRPGGWNPESFAREQIRGLVRQVFLSNPAGPIRQVVFSGLEKETDIRTICRRNAEELAFETSASIAVVGAYPQLLRDSQAQSQETSEQNAGRENRELRQSATRIRGNVWLVPSDSSRGDAIPTATLRSILYSLRREFEYSIVEGPVAGESNTAAAMAQMTDGIILVVSAQRTRRASARKIKESLDAAQVRILGIVLSDRVFPIPERLYRRL